MVAIGTMLVRYIRIGGHIDTIECNLGKFVFKERNRTELHKTPWLIPNVSPSVDDVILNFINGGLDEWEILGRWFQVKMLS